MSSSNKKRSVHFSESTTDPPPPQKRHRNVEEDCTEVRKPSALRSSTLGGVNKNKINNRHRTNEDELDDIDDWNEREDGDDTDLHSDNLPSQSQLIEAKRKRRQIRGNGALFNDDEEHMDDAIVSLATDGVKIEPFHMRAEESDGTGYFDGDTFVFRKHPPLEEGEPDAWADTLIRNDDQDEDHINIVPTSVARRKSENNESSLQEDLDSYSKEQLYKRILPLIGDTESIMQAIRRYGKLVKNRRKQKVDGMKNKTKQQTNAMKITTNDNSNVAKESLDELTGAANALLLKGEVDVYSTTKKGIFYMFPLEQQQNMGSVKNRDTITKWEYQGNEDNQLHGPFTAEQMLGWVQAGYFVGTQRVKIRTFRGEKSEERESLSTQDDLLADLMDDDDDDDDDKQQHNQPPNKKSKNSNSAPIRGEWMWSNEVDYQKYL